MRTLWKALPIECGSRRTAPPLRDCLAALLCLGLTIAVPVAGDTPPNDPGNLADLSLEDLMNVHVEQVVSASRYEQKVTQVPASVTIVTVQEIRQFGYRTLADILRSVPGLYVTYDRHFSSAGFRGFNRPGDANDRILLMVDGHRMNDDFFNAALIGREFVLDVDLIERVEIIRGPSSSIYGSNAFLGVINVITRRGDAIGGTEVSASDGSFKAHDGRLTYGKQFGNDLDVVLSGSVFDTAGQGRLYFPEFDTPGTNHGIAEDADGEHSQNFFGRLAYQDLTLSAAYSLREKNVPIAAGRTFFNDNREETASERSFLDLLYEHEFSPGSTLLGRLHYDHYGFRGTFPSNISTPDTPNILLIHTKNYGDGAGVEVQWTTKLLDRHTVLFGVEYHDALNQFQSSFQGDPPHYNFLSDHQGRSMGAYSQVELAVLPRLRFDAGLRYDHYDNFGGTINPRLGAIYNPWTQTTIKLLYGRAYRAPNAYELYFEAPGLAEVSHDLAPETIVTNELVLEQYLLDELKLRVSGYRYDIRNLISQRQDPANGLLVFQNIDTVMAEGIEVELEGRYAHGLLASVSYALQHAEDGKTGRELVDSPRELAKINLSLPLIKDHVHAGLELQYSGGITTLANQRTSGSLVANATVLCPEILPHLEISFSVYNLFNQTYADPGSATDVEDLIRQDGRNFNLKGTYKF
jgi:outer membrane receptor for ferrienterochelin and colicins